MGWGDEIMATAQARKMQERDPRRVVVINRRGQARWHPIFDNNPRLAAPGSYGSDSEIQILRNFGGARPYLDYSRFNNKERTQAYVYTDFRVEPGEIYLSPEEKALARLAADAIILEPNIKSLASPNKDWGFPRWEQLARALRGGRRLVQIGPAGTRLLAGVEWIRTEDIRKACGVLSGAALLIAPEGGLHHAAAALGIRAVVIFGGFISPMTTGYDMHRNFFVGGEACGMRIPCRHCRDAMANIRVDQVAAAAVEQLEGVRA